MGFKDNLINVHLKKFTWKINLIHLYEVIKKLARNFYTISNRMENMAALLSEAAQIFSLAPHQNFLDSSPL